MKYSRAPARHSGGFTMVELIVAMVVASIVVGFVSMMITTPINAYVAQTRRSELNDSATTAIRYLAADIGKALPNSVRTGPVGAATALEMIEVAYIANYRDDASGGADILSTGVADGGFDVLNAVPPVVVPTRLVVGNLRDSPNSAYRTDGSNSAVITPITSTISLDGSRTHFTIAPNFTFTQASAQHRRLYVIGAVTRYECNPATGELRRYYPLPITNAIGAVGGPSTLIARDITSCTFQIGPGNGEHGGIVTINLTAARAAQGNTESLRMVRQIPVRNPS